MSTGLEKLSKSLSEQLAKISFPEEERRFVAHLTVGRVRSSKEKGKLREALKKFEKIEFGGFQVSSLSLIKSQLTPAGPIYTVLKKFDLQP